MSCSSRKEFMNCNTPNFRLENWDLRKGISWNNLLETRFDQLIFWQYFPFSAEEDAQEDYPQDDDEIEHDMGRKLCY